MSLTQTLLELNRHHMAALPERDRVDLEDELDRLRMMRVAEEGLALGDLLPDFALRDTSGVIRTPFSPITFNVSISATPCPPKAFTCS